MRQIIVVAGPTAVGKTKYAIEIAKAVDGQIVSCDSMQLYQYMNIGSAKPTAEECAEVKHYLVDEIDPKEPFSAAKYQQLAKSAINEIFSLGKVPVISGGTGLYLNTLLYNMDFSNAPQNPELRKTLEKEAELFGAEYLYKKLQEIDPKTAERIHPNNVKKVIRALEGASTGNSITDFKNCFDPASVDAYRKFFRSQSFIEWHCHTASVYGCQKNLKPWIAVFADDSDSEFRKFHT